MGPTVLVQFRKVMAPAGAWRHNQLWYGWSMALISTLAFSVAPPIAKAAIRAGIDPTSLLMIRLVISSLLLGGSIALVQPRRLAIDRWGLMICTAAGLTNGVGMLTFFWALARIEASVVSMIFSLSPLAVLALLALRGERFTRRHFIRLGLGISGIYLLLGSGSSGAIDWLGVSLVFVTNLCAAFHLCLIQWFLQDYDARTVTLYVVANMTLVSIGFWVLQDVAWVDPGWSGWLAVGVLAVISTYLARLTLFAGVRSLGSGQIALLAPVETLLSVFWSVLFLHEWLTIWQWLGGLLILTSALLAARRLNRAKWRPRWRVWARP